MRCESEGESGAVSCRSLTERSHRAQRSQMIQHIIFGIEQVSLCRYLLPSFSVVDCDRDVCIQLYMCDVCVCVCVCIEVMLCH